LTTNLKSSSNIKTYLPNKLNLNFWEAKSKKKRNLKRKQLRIFSISFNRSHKRRKLKFQLHKLLILKIKSLKRRKRRKKLVLSRSIWKISKASLLMMEFPLNRRKKSLRNMKKRKIYK